MKWAPIFSAVKALWSLLVAAALIWSGVALTATPRSAEAALVDFNSAIIDENSSEEDEGDGDSDSRLAAGNARQASSVRRPGSQSPHLFDPDANYRVLTRYGSSTTITLADFLPEAASNVSYTLDSCDGSRADYYNSAEVENGQMLLESNSLGHVHGSNTQSETVCTVTATGDGGSQS